jgi:RNA polymerase sigma-70 factor (ECF subfamily)
MAGNEGATSIRTRPSLLNRLKTGGDSDSWEQFYLVYGKIVRDFAMQAGLSITEADDVVQETAIAMARHLPEFRYDPKVCRFKTWLLNQASWRIKHRFKNRQKEGAWLTTPSAPLLPSSAPHGADPDRTATSNRAPDTAATDLDTVFETQWRKNLFTAALEQVKEKFSLKQFQIFDLLVVQEWPAAKVARSFGVTLANVYVTRHRISAAIKREIKRLEHRLEQEAEMQMNQATRKGDNEKPH